MKRSFAYALALSLTAGTVLAAAPERRTIGAAEAAAIAMRASVDAQGNLRQPTAEEIQKLIAQAEAAAPPSVMRISATAGAGGVGLAVSDAFDHAYLARTAADGNLVFTCTDDHVEAASFVAQSAQADTILRIRAGVKRAAEKE
jgi:hypothetical protein